MKIIPNACLVPLGFLNLETCAKPLCLMNLHESANFSLLKISFTDNACVNNDEGVIKALTLYLQEVQKDL